jgi:hypothetical protein|tara:strand:- start:1686 stop:3935 length:2250 start_codon:yes stop_codon:yes gene_type:complete
MPHKHVAHNFRVLSAEQFKESLTESANTLLYLFYGNHIPFPDDNTPPGFEDSENEIHYKSYQNMIGGKQVTDADALHMITRTNWTNNTPYVMYDDQKDHLMDDKFTVVVNETSGYNVFKCLDNNYGANSIQAPSLTETSSNDEIYITASDGYQWKYMYTVPVATMDKFATTNTMPVVLSSDVKRDAIDGTLQVIKVTEGGRDYSAYAEGFISEFNVAGDPKLVSISGTTSSVFNIGSTSGFVKEEIQTKFIQQLRVLSGGAGYLATDTVTIVGSAQVAATANIASVNANGSITGVNLITKGKSYVNTATVTITTNTGSSASLTATVGTANGIIVDSNSTHLTVSSIKGDINTSDEIKGVTSGTTSNISSVIQTGDTLSSNVDFYKGSSFYVESGTGAGQLGIVDEYIVTANEKRVLLTNAFSTNLATDSRYSIGPQVIITGDGTGAQARAKINSVLNANVVANVEMISVGAGYTYADVVIQGNTGFVTNATSNSYIANTAKARAVISPENGHGSNTLTELFASKIGISISIANTEAGKLSANNDFREVGLLRDPLFANGTLVLSSSDTTFSPGESITGATSGATAVVISSNASGIACKNIRGFFQTETISGNAGGNSVISAVTQPTTVYRQTFKYNTEVTYAGIGGAGLIEDEQVTQAESLSSGYVLAHPSNSDGVVELTNVRNTFLMSDVSGGDKYLNGVNSTAQFKLTSVTLPEVKAGSGSVIYKENFVPVNRDNNQTETFKLIIDF